MFRTATRTRPCRGETRNGDRAVVRREDGRILVAVVDALGHGPVAADVADLAERALLEAQLGDGVVPVLERLHVALRGTRGAAATVLLADANEVAAAGIGNVALRVTGLALAMVPVPGIVGVRARSFRGFEAALSTGARLVLFSDGISSRFSLDELTVRDTERAADSLFERCARDHDDATLVVLDIGRG